MQSLARDLAAADVAARDDLPPLNLTSSVGLDAAAAARRSLY